MAQDSLISSSIMSNSFQTFTNLQNSKNGSKFECRVCEEGFTLNGEKVPRLLFCGHTLCHTCLQCLTNQDSNVLCPFDRQPTPIGPSGVWGLKKNFALLELLERLLLSNNEPHLSCDILSKQKELRITCDEDENHLAVLYCTVCASHMCLECSESTHATKTLHIHKRIPLSEKPREKPRCQDHSSHPVEFVCLEDSCRSAPLLCFICKDYKHTKHKHALLDQEAEKRRTNFSSALQNIRKISNDLRDVAHKLENVASEIEGSSNVSQNAETSITVSGNLNASPVNEHENENPAGTAEEARSKVICYFKGLRDTLMQQESAALRVLDTHVRERICSIKQQQEDISNLLSQMISVVTDCERIMQLDDGRLILASHELGNRIAHITSQEQQLAQIVSLVPHSSIPITFTKDNRIHIGTRIEMRVVALGLDCSGKTTILFKLKNDELRNTVPTIGFNVETIEYKNFKFTFWDVGGLPKLRPLWRHYYFNTQAVIFVVDATNVNRMAEAQAELTKLLSEKVLKDASLLIFANKAFSPDALSVIDLKEALNVHKLCLGRSWHLQPCDAYSGNGLDLGLDWLARQLMPTEIGNIST